MDLAPPGEVLWVRPLLHTGDRWARRGERETHAPGFLRFPTALSGLCKENIEESWSRAKVRSLRELHLVAWVTDSAPTQSASGEICRVAHRLLRRLHDHGRYRRLCHRP